MTIGEVCKKYNLSIDTIRFYEKSNLLPIIQRNKSGYRVYSETDCKWIEFIKYMRAVGISIKVLQKYTALYQEGSETHAQRKQILQEQLDLIEKRMSDIHATHEKLKYKVEHYDDCVIGLRKNLCK
ncbi:MAG: MerR family transcriptional regulator [Treponemataceae bacterium]